VGGAALVVAFLLALAPGTLSGLGGGLWGLDSIPWTPIALLPWLALAGCPRTRPPASSPAAVVGMLLPLLALSIARDLSLGEDPTTLLTLAGWGVVVCAGLALASRRGTTLHAAAWWLALPLAASLEVARLYVGELSADGALARALAASPLVWATHAVGTLHASPAPGLTVPIGPLAVVALLVLAGGRGRHQVEGTEEGR